MATPRLPSFYRLVARERIDSTNEEAKRLAAGGAPQGTLVWAGEQQAGRGRRGRGWASPPGNLYVSLLLRPACPPAQACQLNFVVAVALAEAVSGLLPAGAAVTLKWPNDVLVGGAKVSGILLEAAAALDRSIDWLVIGVGVNLASHPAETPYPATDLRREGAADVTVAAALQAFAERFLAWYEAWRGQGFAPVRARWLASARGLGEPIEVRLDRESLQGRFGDLDESGALMLDMPDGARRQITTGDLFFPQL
ncbi:MAG TPA: biotin--[acetyl-CoA-carboxylase] ligase [Candidatus Angelobacter sp.]|nr:biotin--[acetyl-CoA-carboxylase] ligase [Candidatus Angelobacter sp.]